MSGVPLTGCKFINAFGGTSSATTTDVYTAPAGKRGYVIVFYVAVTGATTQSFTAQIKIGGSYYPVAFKGSVTTGTVGGANAVYIILEPGESIAMLTSAASACEFCFQIVEYDSTVPVRSVLMATTAVRGGSAFGSGNNAVYTCPANTYAITLGSGIFGSTATASVNYVNQSGGSLTPVYYVVPSGQSIGNLFKIVSTSAVSTGNVLLSTVALCFGPGDTFYASTGSATATQLSWINVAEVT